MIETLLQPPPGVEPGAALVLVAVSFAASFITVAFGIGGGGLLLAVMATLVPIAALIPVHGLIQLGSNATRAALLVASVHWPALGVFTAGAVVGCGLGGALVVELPGDVVRVGVGLFVIWTVLSRPPRWLTDWPALTGLLSSFLTMFFGATGLFVASYSRAFGLPRHGFVATHAALMTVQHGLKVLVFGLLGFAFADWAAFVAAMIAAGVCGTLAGRLFLDRVAEGWFRRGLDVLLILISAQLVLAGLGLI